MKKLLIVLLMIQVTNVSASKKNRTIKSKPVMAKLTVKKIVPAPKPSPVVTTVKPVQNTDPNQQAGLQLNPTTYRYYSVPANPNINQNEYHILVWQCKDILMNHAQSHAALLAQYPGAVRSSAYDPNNIAGKNAVEQYLQRIATPTSVRLLEDLKKKNFVI